MIEKVKKYLSKNKKAVFQKTAVLILFLLIVATFFGNLLLAKNLIFISVEDEKATHAREICEKMNLVDKQADFFLEKISQKKDRKNYLSKNEKKEIILKLRKMEGNIRDMEISYDNFFNNDFSIKFFSCNKNSEADKLFSQIKNLPVYGYRAVHSMEDSLGLDYVSDSRLEILEIEFGELKEKIKSIRLASSCD